MPQKIPVAPEVLVSVLANGIVMLDNTRGAGHRLHSQVCHCSCKSEGTDAGLGAWKICAELWEVPMG